MKDVFSNLDEAKFRKVDDKYGLELKQTSKSVACKANKAFRNCGVSKKSNSVAGIALAQTKKSRR